MNVETKEAGLTGNLSTVPLSDLLQLINGAGKTGMLLISRDNQKREIYFMKGSIIYASSSGKESELLGNLLLARKRISPRELERVLSLQKLTGKRLGTILMEIGILTKEELIKLLHWQIEEIVYNTFGWNSGEFTFYEGKLPPAEQITVKLNTLNVIMEGTKRIDEWIQIQQVLPADDVKLKLVKNPQIKSDKLTLTIQELQLLHLIDGERTVPELLQMSPLSEFQTRKALYNLIRSGLVEEGGKKTKIQKIDDAKLLLALIIKLYSKSYQIIERMASQKLGEGAKKILKRCFDDQKSLNPILEKLESSENFLDFRPLGNSTYKMLLPVRFHKLIDGLNDLLLEFLSALTKSLGKNLAQQIISQIKKETAGVIAEQRWMAKEYELEDELLKTLRKAKRCI